MRTLICGLVVIALVFPGAALTLAQDDFKLEPGFTLLFNGKDLTGWKTKKGGESLNGKTEAYGKRFTVVDGKLVIDPKVKGDVTIETAKEFKDVHIKFEYFPGEGCNNDMYIRGQKFDITLKLKGVKKGEWNQFEIIVAGDKAEFKNNSEVVKTAKPGDNPTTFGLRAEFGSIEYRRIRVKEGL